MDGTGCWHTSKLTANVSESTANALGRVAFCRCSAAGREGQSPYRSCVLEEMEAVEAVAVLRSVSEEYGTLRSHIAVLAQRVVGTPRWKEPS